MNKSNRIFNGAMLTVAMRWSDRLIGLVSTVFLARLLVPADFGIVAMAMLVVGFVDVFLNLGVNQVLIHNNDAKKEDYDTAWTVRFIQAACVGIIVFFTAPLAVAFFDMPDVENVLRVIAFSIFIGGFENIGIITFQKEMKFDRDFKFFFIKRVIGFLVTLTIALLFQTYWAMVVGAMVGRISGVLLSYIMHPFRPRFSLVHIRAIWSFSQWVLIKNVGGYFDGTMDRLLIGNRLDADALGGYTLAGEIASLPTTELLAPIGRVLFPAFVEKRNAPDEFAGRVTLAIGVQGLVALPACVGVMFVAYDLVEVVLGSKWLFIAPLIQIMAISNLIVALAHSCGYALLALGKVRVQAIIIWIQAILFLVVALAFGAGAVAEEFALMRLLVVFAGSSILISLVIFQLNVLSVKAFLCALIRPVIAVLIMFFSLAALHPVLVEASIVGRLLVEILVGGAVYCMAIGIMWSILGRPNGAETYLLSNTLYKLR